MTVRELYEQLNSRYPKTLSASWDNDGIMVSPDLSAEVGRVLVSLDATAETILYAGELGFDTVVTHHPMLFRGAKSVTADTVTGQRILFAMRYGITVISLHTRLDAGEGGVNDTLCAKIGLPVTGTFGDDDAPALGRIAEVEPMTGVELALRVKEALQTTVRVTGPAHRKIRRIGVCSGDGKDFIEPALAAGCDAYITGDAGYNAALDAGEAGLVTIEAGHYFTEQPVCASLASLIREITGLEPEIFAGGTRHQLF